jgi:hypothetical protein
LGDNRRPPLQSGPKILERELQGHYAVREKIPVFVRFRKIPNGARRPLGIRPEAISWTRPDGWRGKTHRRWVIGKDGREPYRIKVLLLENKREDGKVRQEIVAALGSFDAVWLESFYEGMTETVRQDDWELPSLLRRTRFWEGVLERMAAIGDNRMSAEDRKRIRRAIHKVVPWVMEAEAKRRDLLVAKQDFENLKRLHSLTERTITRCQDSIRDNLEQLEAEKQQAARLAECIFGQGLEIAKLS